MNSPGLKTRVILGVVVLLAAVLLPTALAIADDGENSLHYDGDYEGYILGDDVSYCYGFWELSFETDTGFFNFHFHGWTDEEGSLRIKEQFPGYPDWVEDLLCSEGGLCIEVAETRLHVNRRGRVLLTCHGFAFPGQCHDEEPPTLVSAEATDSTTVVVVFSEAISKDSVENPYNYSIIPPLTVFSATRDDAERNKVTIKTSPQTPGRFYRITVYFAEDLAGNDLAYPNFAYFSGGSN